MPATELCSSPWVTWRSECMPAWRTNSLPQYMRSLLRNDLIILDEVGYLTLDKTASDNLFQLVNKAYERVSLIVTSNLDFAE